MREVLAKLKALAWFLPGFLLWAAYPPMGEKTDVLFALAPLIWLARQGEARTSAMRWLQSGLFYWVATLSWMPAIVKNGGPVFLVVLGWFALAAYCAAYFAAYGYLAAKVWAWAKEGGYGRRIFAVFLAEPVLWCGLELVRSRLLGGFSWNQLGVVAVNGGFGSPAAIGGVYLCSAVVFVINGSVAGIVERMRRQAPRFAAVETVLAFGLVWAAFAAGDAMKRTTSETDGKPLKVAMLQRNFPCVFSSARNEDPYAVYSNLYSRVEALSPDLVVLPESAMCEFGAVDSAAARGFAEWLTRGKAALIAGGGRREDGREFNSAAIYSESGLEVYDKVHLVPFGEFIPGDKWITSLQALAPVGSCTPGELKPLRFGERLLGVAICFEDTDSRQMRELARKGAQALVFITNDSWFSRSVEARQHAWQAVARAVETGLPVVRVGNSGVTGTITAEGKVSWLIGKDGKILIDRQGTMFDRLLLADIGAWSVPTVYVLVGDWPLGTLFVLLISAMILVKYRYEYEKRRKLSV